jgi:DNA-binding protein Fis
LAAGSTDLRAEVLAHPEARLLPTVLDHTSRNQGQAAKILGIARNGLRKKMAALDQLVGRGPEHENQAGG